MERCATTSDQYNQGKGEMCSWFIEEWKILIKTFKQYSRVTEACVFFSCFCLYWNIKIMRLKLWSNFLFLGSGAGKRKGGGGGGDMRSEEHFNMSSADDIQQLICFSETSLRVKASNSRESPIWLSVKNQDYYKVRSKKEKLSLRANGFANFRQMEKKCEIPWVTKWRLV